VRPSMPARVHKMNVEARAVVRLRRSGGFGEGVAGHTRAP
jgi:hypothetical protein